MDNYLKEVLEIVKAQASVRSMTEDEITSMIQKLSKDIRSITDANPTEEIPEANEIDASKAIKEKTITCAECGRTFKLLTKKHLASHGLTPDEYREKCGYKKNAPLVCKALQRERRKTMKDMKLWERRGAKKKV
ncbi:MAG: MucR family transcriptional regulator [Deltaproteobacteria bacterium]|jgi:predicted transcriptional regulator|nr:MucR family transcriptional regulator [Deltaproteobacteria bacterium]